LRQSAVSTSARARHVVRSNPFGDATVTEPRHAEIVGAGFGGLVGAIGLAQRGWTVRVRERRASLQGEGYGIAIHKNMAHIFSEFGILEQVLAGGMKIDRRDSINAQGHVVLSRPTERSRYRIDREHIIALLAERARAAGVDIQFNAKVESASPDGTITLADGRRHRADLVVAADGVNSSIREQLGLLRRRVWGRDCGVRVTIPRRPEEIAADDREGTVIVEAWADRRRVICCPVTKGEYYLLLTCTARDTAARQTPIDPAVWARSFPWMRTLFERIRDEADWSRTQWDHFQTIRLKRWSAGRVAVLGDAAHAMPPYLAQGAGHAMMNALGLAASLETAPSLEVALAQWEARERPLTEHTQRWTRIYGTTMFLPKTLKTISIQVEKLPWVSRQYLRTASHVPTGCRPSASPRL
jgi:2-polyprenyl-6-methoxyphenol hydroxylase-like FAD-dependent oxidoreductase